MDKAIERAHHQVHISLFDEGRDGAFQIEEQESFALKLQRQLRTAEEDVKRAKEREGIVSSQASHLQDELKEARREAHSAQLQVQDLKSSRFLWQDFRMRSVGRYQLGTKNEELRQKQSEIERQKKRHQTEDAELVDLREEYLRLQRSLRTELSKIETATAEEEQKSQVLNSLRIKQAEMQEELQSVIEQNRELLQRNRELEGSCETLEKLLLEARSSKVQWTRHAADEPLHPKEKENMSLQEESSRWRSTFDTRHQSRADDYLHSARGNVSRPATCASNGASKHTENSYRSQQLQDGDRTVLGMNGCPSRPLALQQGPSPLKWEEDDLPVRQSSTHTMMQAPYATQHSLQDMQQLTRELESHLMQLSLRRNRLQSEYAKMPAHAGRTLAARARKQEVEHQMETIAQDMSRIRLKLKYITGNIAIP